MNVSASIVTYNNQSYIAHVLKCLIDAGIPQEAIFVIDNASFDGTPAIVRECFPSVRLMAMPKNTGFSRGHNAALKEISSDYHLIVNPDIDFSGEELEKMLRYASEHPDVALLTPKVLNPDGTEQFLPKRRPTFRYLISGRLEKCGKVFYNLRSEYTMRGEEISSPTAVDFCSGCFMLCRTDALKECGGFDERFFMYFEDVDLTFRMQALGKTVYFPGAFVYHVWMRGYTHEMKLLLIHVLSMIKFYFKWRKMPPVNGGEG